MPYSRIPTTTKGAFFLSNTRPLTSETPDGFMLELHVFDRIAQRKVEGYRARWHGPAARAWWQEHSRHLRAGDGLALMLRDPYSVAARTSETHAVIVRCELLSSPAQAWIREDFEPAAHAAAPSFPYIATRSAQQ